MLKVLELGKYFPPARGGIETYLATLARRLSGMADVEIMVFRHDLSLLSRRETWEGIPVLRVGRQIRLLSAPLSAALPIHLQGRHWDIIHLHMPNP